MITLRPHQVGAIAAVDIALNDGNKAVMCVLPTGSGKSLSLAEYARRAYHNKELCVIFAHRDVLISQLSEALCKTGVPHTFICSDKARRDITNNNHIQFGDSYWEETSPVIVSSTPTFSARLRGGKLDSDFLSRVKWWLQDECFPAGTLVDGKPIETLRVGDYVTSYNENTGEFEKKRVTNLFVNDGHDTMCVIKIKGIDDVVCTLNHPIFTRRGWVPAFLLNEDDEVLIYGNRGKMHNLWVPGSSGLSVQKTQVHKDGSGLLLGGLFNCLSFNNQLGDDDSDESEILLRTDEKKQPDEAKRVSGKDERNPRQDRTSSKCERWKRKTADCSRKSTSVQVGTSGFFTRDLCENTRISSGVQCSTCIQSRLRKPGVEIGNRGRRVQSLCKIETEAGREENNVSFFSRLDSVEIYQRTDTDKHGRNYDFDYVYNIEVEDNHTYIVNGLVVHNCHHCIDGNQWHTCLSSMPNATGIGFTATPIRGDKKGLGSHADGIFDYLSCTVNMWDLIQAGMLAPYRIFAHGKIDVTGIKRDSNGDLNTKQLRIKTKEADITGDAVEQYRKHLNGKPVITFCINIEHAKEVADEFNAAGIPSIAVSSKQPLAERQRAMDMMRDGRILNLVNVDLLGEGYDCPSVAGVIMMRRTVSYSLFKQQFGRMLRLADGKKYGILIDMVGNTRYMMETFRLHYPHDDPDWTLDRLSDKKIKECPACHSEKFFDGKCRECGYIDEESQYESMECRECGAFGVVGTEPVKDMLVFINGVCPECGHVETEEEKIARVREIKVQAGDLEEQSFDLIDELLAKRESLYVSVTDFAKKLPDHLSFKRSAVNNHATRQSNLDILRHWIQKWSEQMWESTNMSPALIQTEFELTFGINVLRCQADYTASQMDELTRKIQQHMRVIA